MVSRVLIVTAVSQQAASQSGVPSRVMRQPPATRTDALASARFPTRASARGDGWAGGFSSAWPFGRLLSRRDLRSHRPCWHVRGWWTQYCQRLRWSDHGEIRMERLHHEIALLEMRSEQLRIHLQSMPHRSSESRQVRSVLQTMQLKMRALREFEHDADKTLGTATRH